MRRWFTFALAPVLLLAVGCAKAPTEKLESAEKAVNEARTAGAPSYMAEDFAKLEGMLANAKKEIADQDAKMALLRDYGKAEQLLASVPTDAVRVTADTAKKKEEAKVAAMQAQQAAQKAVKTAQDLVAKAPAGKDRAALEAIKADAKGLTTSLTEVQAAIDAGDYLAAQAKAKAIREKSEAVATEIRNALAKVSAAKAPKGKPAKK
ncbi:MAG: hypothetical protein HY581_00525 [Nitrospirae bacterium]|nr:hypothetical protein [Nitrospirota bacterium]